MARVIKGKPPRLERVFQCYDPPLYFLTLCTLHRRKLLDRDTVHDALLCYASRGKEMNIAVGRYVVMPDHMHIFVRLPRDRKLGMWVRGLKRATVDGFPEDVRIQGVWQPGYFDHVLRNSESYSEKWSYVLQNPVRAGLVALAEDWVYQGEVVCIDRV